VRREQNHKTNSKKKTQKENFQSYKFFNRPGVPSVSSPLHTTLSQSSVLPHSLAQVIRKPMLVHTRQVVRRCCVSELVRFEPILQSNSVVLAHSVPCWNTTHNKRVEESFSRKSKVSTCVVAVAQSVEAARVVEPSGSSIPLEHHTRKSTSAPKIHMFIFSSHEQKKNTKK
jgi:hypothetical protein